MNKEELEEIRDAEKWFNNSEYGKGRIAGFVTHLMVDYAKYYHAAQSLKGEGARKDHLCFNCAMQCGEFKYLENLDVKECDRFKATKPAPPNK